MRQKMTARRRQPASQAIKNYDGRFGSTSIEALYRNMQDDRYHQRSGSGQAKMDLQDRNREIIHQSVDLGFELAIYRPDHQEVLEHPLVADRRPYKQLKVPNNTRKSNIRIQDGRHSSHRQLEVRFAASFQDNPCELHSHLRPECLVSFKITHQWLSGPS